LSEEFLQISSKGLNFAPGKFNGFCQNNGKQMVHLVKIIKLLGFVGQLMVVYKNCSHSPHSHSRFNTVLFTLSAPHQEIKFKFNF
jgi:hypothetical protein